MFYFSTRGAPAWVEMENSTIKRPLYLYLYSSEIKVLKKQTHNPFLKNTISTWHEAHTFLNQTIKLSGFTPIWGNDSFKPGRNDMGFIHWMDNGLIKIGDLYNGGTLMSFQQLVDKYKLQRKHFFKYLQISFIHSQIKTNMEPSLSTIEQYTVNNVYGTGQLSRFYNMLLAGSKENSHSYLSAWKSDLQMDISVEEWEKTCLLARTQTINTRCKMLQYKWLFRTYITPVRLHHFNANIPDTCIKCNEEVGTLFHCMWACRKIQIFWREVLELISRLTENVVPVDARLCILHIYPEDIPVNARKRKLINFCLLQAKRVIALKWKEIQRPTSSQWIKEMSCSLAMEK